MSHLVNIISLDQKMFVNKTDWFIVLLIGKAQYYLQAMVYAT